MDSKDEEGVSNSSCAPDNADDTFTISEGKETTSLSGQSNDSKKDENLQAENPNTSIGDNCLNQVNDNHQTVSLEENTPLIDVNAGSDDEESKDSKDDNFPALENLQTRDDDDVITDLSPIFETISPSLDVPRPKHGTGSPSRDVVDGLPPSAAKSRSLSTLPSIEEDNEEDSENPHLHHHATVGASSSLSSLPSSSGISLYGHVVQGVSSKPTLTSIEEEGAGNYGDLSEQIGDDISTKSDGNIEIIYFASQKHSNSTSSERDMCVHGTTDVICNDNEGALSFLEFNKGHGDVPMDDALVEINSKIIEKQADYPGGEGCLDLEDKIPKDFNMILPPSNIIVNVIVDEIVDSVPCREDMREGVLADASQLKNDIERDDDEAKSNTGYNYGEGCNGDALACSAEKQFNQGTIVESVDQENHTDGSQGNENCEVEENVKWKILQEEIDNSPKIEDTNAENDNPIDSEFKCPTLSESTAISVEEETDTEEIIQNDEQCVTNDEIDFGNQSAVETNDPWLGDDIEKVASLQENVVDENYNDEFGMTKTHETGKTEKADQRDADDNKKMTNFSKAKGSGSDSKINDTTSSGCDVSSTRESHSEHTMSSANSDKQDKEGNEKDNQKQRDNKDKDREGNKRKRDRGSEEGSAPIELKGSLKNAVGDVCHQLSPSKSVTSGPYMCEIRGSELKTSCRLQCQISDTANDSHGGENQMERLIENMHRFPQESDSISDSSKLNKPRSAQLKNKQKMKKQMAGEGTPKSNDSSCQSSGPASLEAELDTLDLCDSSNGGDSSMSEDRTYSEASEHVAQNGPVASLNRVSLINDPADSDAMTNQVLDGDVNQENTACVEGAFVKELSLEGSNPPEHEAYSEHNNSDNGSSFLTAMTSSEFASQTAQEPEIFETADDASIPNETVTGDNDNGDAKHSMNGTSMDNDDLTSEDTHCEEKKEIGEPHGNEADDFHASLLTKRSDSVELLPDEDGIDMVNVSSAHPIEGGSTIVTTISEFRTETTISQSIDFMKSENSIDMDKYLIDQAVGNQGVHNVVAVVRNDVVEEVHGKGGEPNDDQLCMKAEDNVCAEEGGSVCEDVGDNLFSEIEAIVCDKLVDNECTETNENVCAEEDSVRKETEDNVRAEAEPHVVDAKDNECEEGDGKEDTVHEELGENKQGEAGDTVCEQIEDIIREEEEGNVFTEENDNESEEAKGNVFAEQKDNELTVKENTPCPEQKKCEFAVGKDNDCVEKKIIECAEEKDNDCVEKKIIECAEEKDNDCVEEKMIECAEEKDNDCVEKKINECAEEGDDDCVEEKDNKFVAEKNNACTEEKDNVCSGDEEHVREDPNVNVCQETEEKYECGAAEETVMVCTEADDNLCKETEYNTCFREQSEKRMCEEAGENELTEPDVVCAHGNVCEEAEVEGNGCEQAGTEETIKSYAGAESEGNVCAEAGEEEKEANGCEDAEAEDNVCEEARLEAGENVRTEAESEDKVCEVAESEDSACDVEESENGARAKMGVEVEVNVCEDANAEDKVCLDAKDNVWEVTELEDNVGAKAVSEDHVCKKEESEDNVCAEAQTEDNVWGKTGVEEEVNICEVAESEDDNVCGLADAEDKVCVEAEAEENNVRRVEDNVSAEENNVCAEEDIACAEEDNICAEEDNVCTEEDNICAEEDIACAEEDNICAEEDNVCTKEDNVCAEEDTVRREEDNVCAEEDNLCAEEDNVSAEEDNVGAEEDNICSEEDNICAEEDNICVEDNLCAEEDNICSEEDNVSAEEDNVCAEENNICAKEDNVREEDESLDSECKEDPKHTSVSHIDNEDGICTYSEMTCADIPERGVEELDKLLEDVQCGRSCKDCSKQSVCVEGKRAMKVTQVESMDSVDVQEKLCEKRMGANESQKHDGNGSMRTCVKADGEDPMLSSQDNNIGVETDVDKLKDAQDSDRGDHRKHDETISKEHRDDTMLYNTGKCQRKNDGIVITTGPGGEKVNTNTNKEQQASTSNQTETETEETNETNDKNIENNIDSCASTSGFDKTTTTTTSDPPSDDDRIDKKNQETRPEGGHQDTHSVEGGNVDDVVSPTSVGEEVVQRQFLDNDNDTEYRKTTVIADTKTSSGVDELLTDDTPYDVIIDTSYKGYIVSEGISPSEDTVFTGFVGEKISDKPSEVSDTRAFESSEDVDNSPQSDVQNKQILESDERLGKTINSSDLCSFVSSFSNDARTSSTQYNNEPETSTTSTGNVEFDQLTPRRVENATCSAHALSQRSIEEFNSYRPRAFDQESSTSHLDNYKDSTADDETVSSRSPSKTDGKESPDNSESTLNQTVFETTCKSTVLESDRPLVSCETEADNAPTKDTITDTISENGCGEFLADRALPLQEPRKASKDKESAEVSETLAYCPADFRVSDLRQQTGCSEKDECEWTLPHSRREDKIIKEENQTGSENESALEASQTNDDETDGIISQHDTSDTVRQEHLIPNVIVLNDQPVEEFCPGTVRLENLDTANDGFVSLPSSRSIEEKEKLTSFETDIDDGSYEHGNVIAQSETAPDHRISACDADDLVDDEKPETRLAEKENAISTETDDEFVVVENVNAVIRRFESKSSVASFNGWKAPAGMIIPDIRVENVDEEQMPLIEPEEPPRGAMNEKANVDSSPEDFETSAPDRISEEETAAAGIVSTMMTDAVRSVSNSEIGRTEEGKEEESNVMSSPHEEKPEEVLVLIDEALSGHAGLADNEEDQEDFADDQEAILQNLCLITMDDLNKKRERSDVVVSGVQNSDQHDLISFDTCLQSGSQEPILPGKSKEPHPSSDAGSPFQATQPTPELPITISGEPGDSKMQKKIKKDASPAKDSTDEVRRIDAPSSSKSKPLWRKVVARLQHPRSYRRSSSAKHRKRVVSEDTSTSVKASADKDPPLASQDETSDDGWKTLDRDSLPLSSFKKRSNQSKASGSKNDWRRFRRLRRMRNGAEMVPDKLPAMRRPSGTTRNFYTLYTGPHTSYDNVVSGSVERRSSSSDGGKTRKKRSDLLLHHHLKEVELTGSTEPQNTTTTNTFSETDEVFEVCCDRDKKEVSDLAESMVNKETPPVRLLMKPLMSGMSAQTSREKKDRDGANCLPGSSAVPTTELIRARPSKRISCCVM